MESDNYNDLVKASKEAHRKWRLVPAPQRGDIIRQFGNELRNEKNELAKIAINIEQNIMREKCGSQDQIWAAYGGFNAIEFRNKSFRINNFIFTIYIIL